MYWQKRVISPHTRPAAGRKIRYPCPGLFRFFGMAGFLIVAAAVYYGGTQLLGLKRLDWAAPAWTTKHVWLLIAAFILGGLAGLMSAAYGLSINVRNERTNYLLIVLWQFLAVTSTFWVGNIGVAMSISLGVKEAKAAVIRYGAERSILHVIGTGSAIGLVMGIYFYICLTRGIPYIIYFLSSAVLILFAAHWHFDTYDIHGKAWIGGGLAVLLMTLLIAPAMIARDLQQRGVVMETMQGNENTTDAR
jgi:hypothetical protein